MQTHLSLIAVAILLSLSVATPASDAAAGQLVAFQSAAKRGTVVVRTSERQLYLVLSHGRALRYSVGVGRAGRQWSGTSFIRGKHIRPNWVPPEAIRRDKPDLPALIPGGASNNPMGVAALTLSGGQYAIHGTNAPKSIGGFVSYGCIRMSNADIMDLYKRVRVGTRVVVTQ
jgi:lipoprotein-anchoring transpeptidase ErfK/SrfK